jgi:hypothetical protein
MVTETKFFDSPDLTELDFCLWGWMNKEVYKRKEDAWDELLAQILDPAARIKKRVDQLRRTIRDLRTGIAKCTEADGGILNTQWTVTNLSFMCNKFVI